MYKGPEIFSKLIRKLGKKESVSSSHWDKYHQNFQYGINGFKGLNGFGNKSNKFRFIHKIFLKKYRKYSSQSHFFEKIDQSALLISKFQKRAYNLDIYRQILTLDFLNQRINLREIERTIVIGDGFGTMATLLLENNLSKQIFLVNLRKTLLVDLFYINKTIGDKRFEKEIIFIDDSNQISKIEKKNRIIAIEAEKYHLLSKIKKDLIINIASFQEMDLDVISNYFKYLYNKGEESSIFIYATRRKILPDGSLIRFKDYPFNSEDSILVDELCRGIGFLCI